MSLLRTLWEYLQSAELPISLAANVILLGSLIRGYLSKCIAKKRLSLLWGKNRDKPILVTFSRFPIDDPVRFGSERTVTHIGDAQSLPIITTMLHDHFSRNASVVMAGELVTGSDIVLLGGPAFNPATKRLLENVSASYVLAHAFEATSQGWTIRDSPGFASRQLTLVERRVVQDFAILGRLSSPDKPDDTCILLAGLSTFGTLGAAIYACDPKRIHDLFVRYPHLKGKQFTALISVCPNDNYTGVRRSSLGVVSADEIQRGAAAASAGL